MIPIRTPSKGRYAMFIVMTFLFYHSITAQESVKKTIPLESVTKMCLEPGDLAKQFNNPPRKYSMLPLWSWNGTLEPDRLKWQMDQMIEKGVYGAFMHARAGIDKSETPYFSDGWWNAVDSTVQHANKIGFLACLYDEDKWPSGSAGGRTVAADPQEFVKKGLHYEISEVFGPQKLNIRFDGQIITIQAIRLSDEGDLQFQSFQDITAFNGKMWTVPKGKWAIIAFSQISDPSKQIDYLDPQAVRTFIDLTHEEYFKRFGQYFGTTIPGIFFDEIYANLSDDTRNIFWTDDFLSQFQNIKGYDLKKYLPLLIYKGGENMVKVRCDYFDVVTKLYINAWFEPYSQWCQDHGIWATGHTNEKFQSYIDEGDYFQTLGQLQIPCTDNEYFRYGFPRRIHWFKPKQLSSIAHIYDRERASVEAMGGGGYVIPLEEYKYGTAMLAAYGINMFIPHLFHYDMSTPASISDWPPSWFYRNPYWKYFKTLADYTRRISFMMSQGHHVCDVAILQPLTSQWTSAYDQDYPEYEYMAIQKNLLEHLIDYDLIDPTSLTRANVSQGKISIGKENYSVLILPTLSMMREKVADQINVFVQQGGIVIVVNSMQNDFFKGKEPDHVVLKVIKDLVGINPYLDGNRYYHINDSYEKSYIMKEQRNGGRGYFTKYVNSLPDIINECISSSVKIVHKANCELAFNQRVFQDKKIYFFVNKQKVDHFYILSFRDWGIPRIWNPETGKIDPVTNYRVTHDGRMEIPLRFTPWQGYFLVFEQGHVESKDVLLTETNLHDVQVQILGKDRIRVDGWGRSDTENFVTIEKIGLAPIRKALIDKSFLNEIKLDGKWDFQIAPESLDEKWTTDIDFAEIELPVMKFHAERDTGNGEEQGWATVDFDDKDWTRVKIKDNYSTRQGCQRYLSDWDAQWITYYDWEKYLATVGKGTTYFRKTIILDKTIKSAYLYITADSTYQLFINGKMVGSDCNWKTPEKYNVFSFLKKGENNISVRITNTKALLLQGCIEMVSGEKITVLSNKEWQASNDNLIWRQAFEYAAPPLGQWGDIPLAGDKNRFPVTLWYRQILPSGIQYLKLPEIKGDFQIFVNGNKMRFSGTKTQVNITDLIQKGKNVLAVKVIVHDKESGIIEPFVLVCGKEPISLVSWTNLGLDWFSGKAIYSKDITIPLKYTEKGTRVILDLGKVRYCAEIWVNDKLVTYRAWSPYLADITEFVRPGKNKIFIVVANLLANKASWNILDANLDNFIARWWHNGSILREEDKLQGGLIGPIRILPYLKKTLIVDVRN